MQIFNQTLQQKEANKGSKRPIEDLFSNHEFSSNQKKRHKRSDNAQGPLSQTGQASDRQEESSRQGILTPFSRELPFDENLKSSNDKFKNKDFKKIIEIIERDINNKDIADKISLLTNKSVRPVYPDDSVLVHFASRVYEEREDGKELTNQKLPEGWKLLITAHNNGVKNRYFGAAYWNPGHQQIVIAHRGTKAEWTSPIKSLDILFTADGYGVMDNNYIPQMNSAATFAYEIMNIVNQLNENYKQHNVNLQLSFTGHSLGGWLAQITAFTTKYLTPIADDGKLFFNKNVQQTGYHAHTVVFDSPGCRDMLSKMEGDFSVRHHKDHHSIYTTNLDIISYLSAPNLINTCRPHVGTIYRVLVHLSEEPSFIKYNLKVHEIEGIKNILSAETPNKNDIKIVRDWPLVTQDISKKAIKIISTPVTAPYRLIAASLKVPVTFYRFLSGGNKPKPLPKTNEYEYFHKLAEFINNYDPEPDDKGGYCTIRYQVGDVIDEECSTNVFTESERNVLFPYENLREFSDSPVFKSRKLFSSLNNENAIDRAAKVLKTFEIKGPNAEIIHCKSLQELQELVSYVKHMIHFFPDVEKTIKNSFKSPEVRKNYYKSASNKYLKSIKGRLSFSQDAFREDMTNLSNFLEESNIQVLQLIFQIDTSIGVNKVYNIFENIKKGNNYLGNDHHIVLNLGAFLNLEHIFKLVKSLEEIKKSDDYHLLMIECKHNDNLNKKIDEDIKKFFEGLFSALEDKPNIKLILITQESNNLSNFLENKGSELGNRYKSEDDPGIKFSDLTEASQDLLLEKKVKFQGKEASLHELVGQKDEKLNEIIDSEVLLKLINDERIEIGIKRPDLSDLESIYYVTSVGIEEEQFSRAVKNNPSDLFVISGTTRDEFSELLTRLNIQIKENTVHVLGEDNASQEDKFIILTDKDEEKKPEDFKRICSNDPERTAHLIEKKGNELTWKRSYDASFYISRELYHVVIKEGSLKEYVEKTEEGMKKSVKKDIFAVSGIENEKEFKKLYKASEVSEIKDLLSLYATDGTLDRKNHIIILKGENEEESFEGLCNDDELKGYNIHWLQNKKDQNNDKLVWRRSKGEIDKIHDLKDESSKFLIDENGLNTITDTEKAIVIADEPGMGKSTTLTHLLRKPEGFEWIIKLNLINLQGQLEKLSNTNELGSIIENFFSKVGIGAEERLAERLLKHRIEHQGKITLLFDGFDEITDKNQETVIKLLQLLKDTKAKIQVTTRLHTKDKLEKALSVFSYTFQAFSREDQLDFLEKFWKASFKLTFDDNDKEKDKIFKDNVNKLFELFHKNIKDKQYEFMSIPLLTRMFAEVYQKIIGNYYRYGTQVKSELSEKVERLSILDLYEKFIERKYEIYFKEKTKIKDAPDYIKSQLTKALNKDHQRLALHNLFSGLEETKILADKRKLLSEEENKDLKLVGIIQSIGSKGDSYFIHKTFAEYFAAGLLADIAERKESNPTKHNLVRDLLREQIFKEENKVIRNFFDRMLAKDKEGENKYEIHTAVLNNDKDKINKLLSNPEKAKDIINTLDKGGRTALHFTAAYGDEETVQVLLKKASDARDKLFGWHALIYAERSYNINAAILLLQKGANNVYKFEGEFISKNSEISSQICDKDILNTRNPDKETLLHRVAEKGYMELTKFLVEKGADVNVVDKEGRAPLNRAVDPNDAKEINFELVKYLVEKGAYVNVADKDGITPLYRAVSPDYGKETNFELVKYLVDKGAYVNVADKDGITPLYRAVSPNYGKETNFELVKYLVDKGAYVNVADKDGITPLYRAVSPNYGKETNFELVKYLVKKGANVNVADKDGRTPLYRAVSPDYGKETNFELVKYLVDKGAYVNVADKDGITPLYRAVSPNYGKETNFELVKYLVKKGANVNVADKDGRTPLYRAVSPDYGKETNFELVKYLVKEGANVNVADKDGRTPLHLAAQKGKLDVVKYLVEKGAEFDTKDNEGKTPLQLARQEEIENILTLAQELFTTIKDNNLNENEKVNNLKDCIERKAIVNALSIEYNGTPLHFAAQSRHWDIAVLLLNHGAHVKYLDYNQKLALLSYASGKPSYRNVVRLLLLIPFTSSQVQSYEKQQKAFLHLSEFISNHFSSIAIKSVKQGLYIPSFEAREVGINGKCAAITRILSQGLFLGHQGEVLSQNGKAHELFLSNLQTSAELYERLAQGKQLSLREEREIFDLSKLLDNFEQQLDSPTSSLPSSLSHIKSYKQSDDLLRYVSDLTGDFAIHLVTSNHVVAIYRVDNIYTYFDSNVAFVSGLKSVYQLIRVLEKAVAFAGYEIVEDGFLVEHFNVDQANNALTAEQKQTLMKPIQTERHLLSVQDQKLGPINLNGQELFRTALYDLGTKLHLKGSVPILINFDMSLNSENLLAYLNAGKISITAREYLENLRNNAVGKTQELVQTTKIIPFAGSRNEIKHAQQIKELLSSDIGSKLKSYELSSLLESPIEKSIKALPYYLEVAKTKHWPGRLTNAAGRIQLIRGVHGAAVSCDRERGNIKDCLLNTGEISLSLVSQLIEDKVVQNVPKLIKSLKTVKFGTHILRGGAAIISSPFDVYDIIDSAIDLHNCEKGSNECKDAIAGVTFASTSLASGVVLTAIGAPGVGTAAGLVIMIAQGAYGGGRAIEEFQPYRLTFDENFRLFWHAFALQPVPTDIEYIKARKDIVSQIAKQIWEQLQNRSEHVVAHVIGLGDVTFKEELECKSVQKGLDRYQACTHRKVRVPIIFPSNAVISMDKDNADTSKLARIIPDLPSSEAEMICLPKWLGAEAYEYRKVPTDKKDCYNNRCLTRYETVPYYNQIPTAVYSCDNAMVISHKERTNQIQVSGNKKIVFDLNLVNQGMIVGSDKWHNDFIIYQGKAKVLGGENTRNTFILTSDSFAGTMFGGKNSTNMLDISNLKSSNYSLYLDNLSPFDRISYVQDYTTNKKQVEEQSHFYGINNVVISANTTVAGNGNSYTFYIKPTPGYSKVNVSKGSIVFPETALLLDCDSFTYSPESNILSMKLSNFTLDIANYFDQQTCNFELIDKHGSVIEPLVDLAQNNSQEVKLFNLRAETDLTYNNITGWYENIAKASGEYQVYGTVRVKYPIAQERYGFYPHKIFGSQKSDVIPLTKETWYAEGRKGSDSYNVILGDSSITTEINNYAEDKSLDLLYMPVNSIQVERDKDDLLLYAANSTHPVKIKNYFLGDNYQHLVVINDNKDTFIPLEGPSKDVSLVPFYHPTDNQHIFSLAAEKVANNSEVIVDAKLDDIKFYRDSNDLLLVDDKPLMVKLENFYGEHGNITLNFWHHNHKDKLSSEQLFELAKLAINYQDEIKSTYYDNVKEYIVSASNTTIHHNQKFVNGSLTTVEPSTKRVGVLALQDPSDIEVSVDNEDLVFFVTQNNATFTIKNWNDTDHRISALKFNREEKSIEVTGLDKFDLSQVSEIQSLINKAALSSIVNQQLKGLDTDVVNGIKYLLSVRGVESGVNTYKVLGFDSINDQEQFISAYGSHYTRDMLDTVLGNQQAVEALVWLVAKGYTNLMLNNGSLTKELLLKDLNQCFDTLTSKKAINRITRKLETETIDTIVPKVKSFIRHHKEALEDKIANSLRSNATNMIEGTEEDNHQRKRRDVRVVKDYKDYVFFNAQNNANSSLKGQQVTSGGNKLSSTNSGSRPSSWVNDFVGWVKNSITGFLAPSTEQVSSNIVQPEISNAFVDGFLILSDVGIRKFTGNKYKQPKHDSLLSPKELIEQRMDHTAINAINSFGKVYDFQNATSKVYDKPMTCLSSISLEKAVINMDSKKGIL